MTVNLFTSKILEAQLEDPIRFLGSDEHPPAQKLHEKLGRITRMLGTITAAVDAQCDQRLRISTPPGNQQPGPSSIYSNHQQLSTPDVFQQHADGHSTSCSPEFIPEDQTEQLSGRTTRKRPLESEGLREGQRSGQTSCKRPQKE